MYARHERIQKPACLESLSLLFSVTMTYYWLGSPVPRFIERIYIACITQHDESLDLDLPYPEPVTADEMRADLE